MKDLLTDRRTHSWAVGNACSYLRTSTLRESSLKKKSLHSAFNDEWTFWTQTMKM